MKPLFTILITIGLFLLFLFTISPSDIRDNETLIKLSDSDKELSEKCRSKVNKAYLNPDIRVIKNEFTKTTRVIFQITSTDFIRCDFDDKNRKIVKAEYIKDGSIHQRY